MPEKCTTCGDCLDACKDFAIFGERRKSFQSATDPFEIVQKRCTKCGECIKVCPEKAICIISSKEMAEKETVGV
jgi:ferredoxin